MVNTQADPNPLNKEDTAYLRGVCQAFFQALVDKDLHDHPKVFEVLAEEVRAKGYAISADVHVSGDYFKALAFERIE